MCSTTADLKRAALVAVSLALWCSVGEGQVLTTAETLGRGNQAVLLSENRIFVDGARLHLVVGQYVRGVSDRVDLYLVGGLTRTDDETESDVLNQSWLGLGGNWSIAEFRQFRVSLFGVLSAPLTRREQASEVLANPALIVSRTVVKDRLTLYGGVNALVPIGHRERGWFTPTRTEVNVPAGAFILLGKWGLFVEGDIGHLKAVGVGLSRSLQ